MRTRKAHPGYTGFAAWASRVTGRPGVFLLAVLLIVGWLVTGPIFGFSDTWQLVINTATTVITFLMVFLIQSTQNRDTEALQIKLDELIRATAGAHNILLNLEELDQKTLDAFRDHYVQLARRARTIAAAGGDDTGTPDAHLGPPLETEAPDTPPDAPR